MRVLVLGAYGFIGAEIVRALLVEGFEVAGLGRNKALGERLVPEIAWIEGDLRRMVRAPDWSGALSRVDAIVNAAGALQDSARDDLEAVHHRAIAACIEAAEKVGVSKFIQISALGAAPAASTAFMRTKAAGDAAVRASSLEWTVFKPGFVIGANAYGGSALVRMIAAMPLMTPLVAAETRMQTVSIDDVAGAVIVALKGEAPTGRQFDLVEDDAPTLREIVNAFRARMGFAPPIMKPDLPRFLQPVAGFLGDAAGLFGWRSPLRSTSMRVLSEDVVGDGAPWRTVTGRSLKPLAATIRLVSASAQERSFARLQLVLPLMIVLLGVFWIASGAIGLVNLDGARAHLDGVVADPLARLVVIGGSILDIAIGFGVLFRKSSRIAALASVGVAALYLLAGTIISPHLWLDPLGVFMKVIPVMALALAISLLSQER